MTEKYWFKPKRYGWGFMPVTWEGWMATLVLVALIFLSAYVNKIGSENMTSENILRCVLDILILGGLFTVLCKDKLEGGLKWRWGNKK